MASAWGSSWGSAWGDAWGAVAAATEIERAYGGFIAPARDHQKRIKQERERLGILPQRVQQAIRQVALEHVTEPDGAEEDLRRAIEAANRTYKALYAELLRQEMKRLQDDEEDAIFLLM